MNNRQQLIADGLDPQHSVVVEACAGSGKTWLLVSRLLRLLLAGVKPSEILAITYTRKAAREIESRLLSWLAELAHLAPTEAVLFLTERGLSPVAAEAALPQAMGLFEAVLAAEMPLTITTFHGWFARLLAGAPLSTQYAGQSLDASQASLLEEAWATLAQDCAKAPDGVLAQALLGLFAEHGAHSTRRLLNGLVERRAEWQAYVQAMGDFDAVLLALQADFGVSDEAEENRPLAVFFTPQRREALQAYASLLGQNTPTDKATADQLQTALQAQTLDEAWASVQAVLLTKELAPRSRKASATQAKRLGEANEARLLDLHAALCAAALDCISALQDLAAMRLSQQALTVGVALLKAFEDIKQARRLLDFTDLECAADRLLGDESTAAFIQARLDARYRQILLDEFQDTNPLQWRILLGWLQAYEGSGVSAPRVFMVGDPKQSIYRFRRADPRLFSAARDWFVQQYGAIGFVNAHTFRNANPIVSVVNAVFSAADGIVDFPLQTTQRSAWPGRVEVLPLVATQVSTEVAVPTRRDPLTEPLIEPEDARRQQEATLLAARILAITGRDARATAWSVQTHDGVRAANFGDILILTRRKTILGPLEAALQAAGIPFSSPGRGGLLASLEAQDVLALLRFLAHPTDDLALAHTLRLPVFAVSDMQLLALAQAARTAQTSWWQVLAMWPDANTLEAGCQRAQRLLCDWLLAAQVLPAHDLLDKIFDQADWLAAYAKVVPAAQWPGVEANLYAVLALALQVDGGRYPSLTRFVSELQRLQSSEDSEAPDEGQIRSSGDATQRVRLMTIHAAKGLEAPIVWLIDAHATEKSVEGYQPVIEWPETARQPAHFSLLSSIKAIGLRRAAWLEVEQQALAREALNLLYVAMTRAEQVLIVSGIQPARGSPIGTPWLRIAQAVQQQGSQLPDGTWVLGEMPQQSVATVSLLANAPAQSASPPTWQIGHRATWQAAAEGMRFGTAMHAWLDAQLSGRPLPSVSDEVRQAAQNILAQPALRQLFDPAHILHAANECAFVLADGTQGRIDRWVETLDAIWLLDYKSGHAEAALLPTYRAQLARYQVALHEQAQARAKPLKSLLIFSHGAYLEV